MDFVQNGDYQLIWPKKILVFRNGGIIKKYEKVYFNGTKLETKSHYKYLGVVISTRLSWSPAQSTLSNQASKAINVINSVNYQCNYSFKTSLELIDKCVLPILCYGSEIWGPDANDKIENVQVNFFKQMIGLGNKTPSIAVLGECGRKKTVHKLLSKVYKILAKTCFYWWNLTTYKLLQNAI